MNNKLSKILLAVTTIAGVAVFALVLNVQAARPADYGLQEGWTISAAGTNDPDIYIVNEPGYKRLFLNPVIFGFYGHLGGFANVKNVSAATRDAFPTSGLFRNCEANDPKVYGVETTGEDTGMLHWVNTTGAQAVADDPNFFNKVFCINNNEFNWYAKGADYTSVNQVPSYSRTPGPSTPPAGNLSASLAADNPASGTLVETQALANLAHFQVGGSGSVTSVTLKRLGISADADLEDVFLFVNGARVSDAGNINSGTISFNDAEGLFTAPATVVVRADIADSTSGRTVGVQLTKLNSQTFALSGNIFSIATDSSLATNTVGNPTGPGNFDPQNDVNVWQANFTISNEDVFFKRLSLREVGSIDSKDVKNLRLFVDGVQVATDADLDADGYVNFLLNHRMLTGTRTIKVVADVVGGANRTMQFSLRGSYDVELVDEAYSVGIESSATGSFPEEPTASTVGSASVTVVKATDSPSGNVTDDATDVAVARFEIQAFGEDIKIETLSVRASVSDSNIAGFSNGRLLIGGVQYGSTANLSTTASTSYTVNYTIAAGAKAVVEVRMDMKEQSSGTDVSADDIISILLDGGDLNNAQGKTSATTVDVPGTTVESNNVTVKEGSATLSVNTGYTDQTITLPKTAFKVGAWVLTNGSVEPINVTTLSLDTNTVDGTSFNQSDITNLYLKYGSSQTSAKSTTTASDNDFSVSRTLATNEVLIIEAYATLGTDVTTGDSFRYDLSVTATGANTGASIGSIADINGQEIDTAAGTFTTSVDSSTAKLTRSNSQTTAGTWRFRGAYDSFTVSELRFRVSASGSSQETGIASLVLKDGGTQVGNALPLVGITDGGTEYVATFSGLNIPIGAEKALTLDINTSDPSPAASTAKDIGITMDYAKYKNSSGVESTENTDRAGASIYVHDSYPSLSVGSLSTLLTTGNQDIAKFTVTPQGSAVALKRIRFDLTKSATSGVGIASSSANDFELYENGVALDVASVSHTGLGDDVTTGNLIFEFASERVISAATEYRLQVNVTSTGGTSKSLVTTISADSSFVAPTSYNGVAATSTFVWSDRSSVTHSETSGDWSNSYLLTGLPASWGKNN